jgi:protease IV
MSEKLKKIFLPITIPLDFIQKYFKTFVFITIVILITNPTKENIQTNNLQTINLIGPIMDPKLVLEDIQKAKEDSNIKGVLLNVNSPGGAVAPSIELAYAINELNEKKPVIVYASGVLASGAYYASIWADTIIANPGSIVGSIGVIFQGANFQELLSNIGIKSQIIKAGQYKEIGTMSREWSTLEKKQLKSVINDTYNMFIEDVSDARDLDIKKQKIYANGKIFTARQSKEVGLIDDIGTMAYAKEKLIKISKVKNPIWNKDTKIDQFIQKIISETINKFSIRFSDGLKAY